MLIPCKTPYFRFRLLLIIRRCHFTPAVRFACSRCEHSQSHWYWRNHSYFLNRRGGTNLQDKYSNKWEFADFLALPIGGVIAERNILYRFAYSSRRRLLIWLQQVETEICILNINYVFKWQIVIDCHSPRLKTNHSHLSDPPHFSLLSSFNLRIIKSGKLAFPSSIDRSVPGVLINLRVCAKLNLAKICLKREN
jgi:hypothetical protein